VSIILHVTSFSCTEWTKNLRVCIFDPAQATSSSPVNIGDHELIEVHGGDVDWQDELRKELHEQVGTMLITGRSALLS
jgi:hypothetical protein